MNWFPRFKRKRDNAGVVLIEWHHKDKRYYLHLCVDHECWEWGRGDNLGYFDSWGAGPLFLLVWDWWDDPETELIKNVLES